MAPGLSRDSLATTTANEPKSADQEVKADESLDAENVITISPGGDVILHIHHQEQSQKFRVSTACLRSVSKYFARLLEPGRFGEGSQVNEQHESLKSKYAKFADVPTTELPVVVVQDLGRISVVKSIAPLCADFLHISHDQEIATAPPVVNLANLAIVADRFDAIDAIRAYDQRKKLVRTIEGKSTAKIEASLNEERTRQRLLVAVFYGHAPWVEKYSARLMTRGWVGSEADSSSPLWYDLPYRIEDELLYRRDCILETIESVQAHFLQLYTSRERQCKLGYDSSGQCDSFQLGEMVKFFRRVDTLRLQGLLFDAADAVVVPFDGDLYPLLDSFRQVPEYQIDRNHNHCGLRSRLVPILDWLHEALQHVGICWSCWTTARSEYAWVDAKRPLLWRKQDGHMRATGHTSRHGSIKAMFTATSRDWA